MLIAYRVLKGILIALVLALLVAALLYESRRPAPDVSGAGGLRGFYETARDLVLSDPYDKNVLARVAEEKNQSRALFSGILSSVSNLIARPDFYNNVFIFMVSKKSEEIARLVGDEFTNIPAFEDLIILDRDNSILYKFGNTSFITANYTASPASAGRTNTANVIVSGSELAVMERYRDATLDSEIRIIALFSPDAIAGELTRLPFPTFLVLQDRVFTNNVPAAVRNAIPLVQQEPGNDRKYYIGNSVIETVSLSVGGENVGALGIVYPARNLGGTIVILLKVAALILAALGLIALDGLAEKAIRNRKPKKAAVLSPRPPRVKRPKRRRNGDPAEDHEAETNLDWVEHYIDGSEKQKKGEDE